MNDLLAINGKQTRHIIHTARHLLDALDDSHRALEPQPGTKTAGWILGHLSVTGDFGIRVCGRPTLCPKDWRAKYNPGTQPSHNDADYPPMSELVSIFRRVYVEYADAAAALDPAALAAPTPFPPTTGVFPTTGDFLAWMLGGHLGYHMGQLHGWAAAAGVKRERGDGL